MEKIRTYSTTPSILREFGNWTNFCLERPGDARDIYNQLQIAALGKAFVECYAGSRKAEYADMARRISKDMARVSNLNGSAKYRRSGSCEERFCRASDFRNLNDMINEGDADGLRFESFLFGGESQVPFGNVQRNYPDSYQDGNPTSGCIGEAAYDMRVKGDFEEAE